MKTAIIILLVLFVIAILIVGAVIWFADQVGKGLGE